jgi:YHS domain-containing protein
MKKIETGLSWLVAVIFLQTLFFKFTGAPESKWIFTTLGVEPWGRILSGVLELVAAVLLVTQRYKAIGALMGCGIMGGAILSHLFILGISVQGDQGVLFSLAVVAMSGSALVLLRRFRDLPFISAAALVLLLPMMAQAKISYNDKNDFGIHGYDPVSYLTESKAKMGDKTISTAFDGINYLFSSEVNKQLFIKTPQKFIPAYGGWCAYAMADGEKVDIDPKTFKVIQGKTYLYYNGFFGNTLEKWNKEESNLKSKADSSWEKLIK